MIKLLLFIPFLLFVCYGDNQRPQISVTGQASVIVDPTDVTISFTLKTKEEEASKALTDNNKKLNSLVDAFKALNITEDELGTSSFTVNSVYENVYVTDHYENIFKQYLLRTVCRRLKVRVSKDQE